ncbi:MAG: phosphoribosylformylglycinamidine synthase [Muribaculaceae bacterium]|nr:phosphoribosylformylglycinamidine synthase [Muribaculaceae bacterium]
MKKSRIFVEKKPGYRTESESLRQELNTNLQLEIRELRQIVIYDIFGMNPEIMEECKYKVFGEKVTDNVSEECDYSGHPHLAIECLPGQFDQRATSAEECVRLIDPHANVEIRSGKLLIFDEGIDRAALEKIERYCINRVESRRKDLSRLELPERAEVRKVETLTGLRDFNIDDCERFFKEKGLAMNAADLMEIVSYFKGEERDPNETELRILDTYWSDHCRHTTFTTRLTKIEIAEGGDSIVANEIREGLQLWKELREETGRQEKPLCLMDLATIGARVLRHRGLLDNLEESEENNACSIYVDAEHENGEKERWLLQFKNETHNHPTEIEPFGGASTCLGGAIRDPLSGRSYVFQAMRITGAGNIYQDIKETLPGKLPQRVISTRAAAGYSSYGNQIGLATTQVREIYHPGYVAKRMEVGAVAGAVRAADVRRECPAPGDVILMFGGRTGRDGIGGATGSSKEHNTSSLEECGSEVQKGNAPEERKLQRLFRRPEVTRLIKKSNDFGAGGVSVAIGELADSLDIYLDRVPTKYSGLNPTEIAISESQERMSAVVESKDKEEFMRLCGEENIEVTHVADVTDSGRMRLYYNGEIVADLKRTFIDSAGAPHYAEATITVPETEGILNHMPQGATPRERFLNNLCEPNVTSQKGLIEMFDSTIGATTVLMPFGGRTQRSETQVSLQALPTGGKTTTGSMMAWGYNPYISSRSPYHGAAYAVTEAIAKAVAAGQDYRDIRFSFQEFFEKLTDSKSWGKPLSALLGALRMQIEYGLGAIGGKDSMSGTFADISVPPTLIAISCGPTDIRKSVSTDFKAGSHHIYLLRHTPLAGAMPATSSLKDSYEAYHRAVEKGEILAAYAPTFGGVAEAITKMSFGNNVGAKVTLSEKDLYDYTYGSIVFESSVTPEELNIPGIELIGETTEEPTLTVNSEIYGIEELYSLNAQPFDRIYPAFSGLHGKVANADNGKAKGKSLKAKPEMQTEHPIVFLPIFPGTNCDYDMERAFRREGAECETFVFRNLTPDDVEQSSREMARHIDNAHILAISGGFSEGDEPDGSGKFIASVLQNQEVKESIERLLARGGLVLGICNGFQALIKSGLLPDGKIGEITPNNPTLFRNDINRHISQIVKTRVGSTASPWLKGFTIGQLHEVAASHGEGKFCCDPRTAKRLAENGQIAFQYADLEGNATMESPWNPNGSTMAIEGIISPDGQILGKMAHSERWHDGLMRNIYGDRDQNLFANAVGYFKP